MVPEMNSNQTNNGEYKSMQDVDISIAVATDKGLITPIVKKADSLSVIKIAETVRVRT